jgi:16S rRNA (cytosine967-C5)-methyltransferase
LRYFLVPRCSSLKALNRGQGRLVAMDVNAARLKVIPKVAAAQGYSGCVVVQSGDLQQTAQSFQDQDSGTPAAIVPKGGFDRVLVDVPCSGLGVLSKRADLRWRRTPSDVKELVQLQVKVPKSKSGRNDPH